MRRIIAAGNWKMHGSREFTGELLDTLIDGLEGGVAAEVLVCPPFVYLDQAATRVQGTAVMLGAQNLSAEAKGAFTGEISGAMLADIGASHCLVGHSERRTLYKEDDALVAAKFGAALDAGLVPVLCVGETLTEREAGDTESVVARQIDAVVESAGIGAFDHAVVAYEPVWAIGTGKTASPDQAQAVHAFIRTRIKTHDATISDSLRILYGGSVKGSNAAELFAQPDVDGGLVGGASLDGAQFLEICRAAG